MLIENRKSGFQCYNRNPVFGFENRFSNLKKINFPVKKFHKAGEDIPEKIISCICLVVYDDCTIQGEPGELTASVSIPTQRPL